MQRAEGEASPVATEGGVRETQGGSPPRSAQFSFVIDKLIVDLLRARRLAISDSDRPSFFSASSWQRSLYDTCR